MKAGKIIEKFVKKEEEEMCAVIAISQNNEEPHWYHVHRDEDIPEKGYDIAIHINSPDLG